MIVDLKFSILVASVLFLAGTPAFADGMPFQKPKPDPMLAPLDKAMNSVQIFPEAQAAQPAPPPVVQAPTPVPPPVVPETRIVEVQPENPSFFGLSIGTYNLASHNGKAVSFNFDWQPSTKLGILQPIFGGMVTNRATMMAYTGLGIPFRLNWNDRIMIMPSLAIAAYTKGQGQDLHSSLALRAGAEIAYLLDDKSRIALDMHVLASDYQTKNRVDTIGIAYRRTFDIESKPIQSPFFSPKLPKVPPFLLPPPTPAFPLP